MKLKSNKGTKLICLLLTSVLAFLCFNVPADASKVKDLENKSDELQSKLQSINQELLDVGNQIAEVEEKIEITDGEIIRTQELLAIARVRENKQYEEMKLRIKYMYENDNISLLEVICQAKSMQQFLNAIEFIQSISEYDREKLDEFHELKETIADQEKHLLEEQEEQTKLQEELDAQEAVLKTKAKETSTNISELKTQIKKIREEEARKAAEAARKAAEAKAKAEAEAKAKAEAKNNDKSQTKAEKSAGSKTDKTSKTAETSSSKTTSSSKYDMPSGDGVLTKNKGVNYYKGHRETYYSQRVLPGKGLKIPGRHVASDGTVRDKDGYICVASSDHPRGTVVDTSLGPGKVYDSGCAKGTIDLYTDW